MLRYLSGSRGRLGSLRTDRELLSRIAFVTVLRFRIGVIWVGCLIDLRHISGIVHCGNGKILIPCIKLLQTDIQHAIRQLGKLITIHIDCLDTGIRIVCLYA